MGRDKVLRVFDRDELDRNGERLLLFAEKYRLTLIYAFFQALNTAYRMRMREGPVKIYRSLQQWRIDYVLLRQTDRQTACASTSAAYPTTTLWKCKCYNSPRSIPLQT